MALPNDIVLSNAQDGGQTTFSLIDMTQGLRADKSRNLSTPRTLELKNSKTQQDKVITDRHLVRLVDTEVINGVAVATTMNWTLAMSRSHTDPKSVAKRLMGYLREFLNQDEPYDSGALYAVLVNER